MTRKGIVLTGVPGTRPRPRPAALMLAGSRAGLIETSQFIATLARRQGLKVACPEEIAHRSSWIDAEQPEALAQPMLKSGYGQYLRKLLSDRAP